MIRALRVAVLILAALAVSLVVWPSPGFDGRGLAAVVVTVVVLRVSARAERGRA